VLLSQREALRRFPLTSSAEFEMSQSSSGTVISGDSNFCRTSGGHERHFVFKRRSVTQMSGGSPFASLQISGLLTKTSVGESKRNPDERGEPTWPTQVRSNGPSAKVARAMVAELVCRGKWGCAWECACPDTRVFGRFAT
jgi:hypothetical protein